MPAFWEALPHLANQPCIAAPEQPTLGASELHDLLHTTRGFLHQHGIGPSDRVALLVPNGPCAATAFLCVAATTAAAPLNPAYRPDELQWALSDLRPRALVVQGKDGDAARDAAARLGIAVFDLQPQSSAAGAFTLHSAEHGNGAAALPLPQSHDTALLLHTSGTTARPKLVPLSHGNLAASAGAIGRTLQLVPGDVCLNIMPLFHIHGLVGCVLAALHAGGSVCCTPGFNALRMLTWLETVRPSWYSAVPTMHQAIVARLANQSDRARAVGLRFIRASSASLPPQVMRSLEDTFGVPVIESYGMTEAAHQMASNPLPPLARKAGSVGLAAGPEVGIMSADGALLPQSAEGEVVIRGANVMAGYADNAAANAAAFTNGWFRTGDQGRLDGEGYLFLTGRIKELINRGGEKISPLEVDAVLLEHPAVAQVATFAVPHAKLGEEVAAAVVLKEAAQADEAELRAFAGGRLAPFKVPRRIVLVSEIPKGPTGKLQRTSLATTLGLS